MKYQTEIELLRAIYNDTENLISKEHAEACRVFFSEPKQPCLASPAEVDALKEENTLIYNLMLSAESRGIAKFREEMEASIEAVTAVFRDRQEMRIQAEINAERLGYLETVANSWGPVDAETLENESPLFIMWKGNAPLRSVIDAELVKWRMSEATE